MAKTSKIKNEDESVNKDEDVVKQVTSLKKSISLNIQPFTNLTIEYSDIEEINKEELLKDVEVWNDILNSIPTSAKATNGKTSKSVKPNNQSNSKIDIPPEYKPALKCSKCGHDFKEEGVDYVISEGVSTKGPWFAFDCQHCESEYNGKASVSRNFLFKDSSTPTTKKEPTVDDFDDMTSDDTFDEIPF